MGNNSPKSTITAIKAIMLHTFRGPAWGLGEFGSVSVRPGVCQVLRAKDLHACSVQGLVTTLARCTAHPELVVVSVCWAVWKMQGNEYRYDFESWHH